LPFSLASNTAGYEEAVLSFIIQPPLLPIFLNHAVIEPPLAGVLIPRVFPLSCIIPEVTDPTPSHTV